MLCSLVGKEVPSEGRNKLFSLSPAVGSSETSVYT